MAGAKITQLFVCTILFIKLGVLLYVLTKKEAVSVFHAPDRHPVFLSVDEPVIGGGIGFQPAVDYSCNYLIR